MIIKYNTKLIIIDFMITVHLVYMLYIDLIVYWISMQQDQVHGTI